MCMKYPWSALVALAAVTAACTTGSRPRPIAVPALKVTHIRVKPDRGPVVRVELEDYVRAATLSEFAPPSGDPAMVTRMLEVQSVIARTYAVAHLSRHGSAGFDLCSTTHCQLYQPERLKTSMWRNHVDDAARRTAGMILLVRRRGGAGAVSRRLRRSHERRLGRLVRARPPLPLGKER